MNPSRHDNLPSSHRQREIGAQYDRYQRMLERTRFVDAVLVEALADAPENMIIAALEPNAIAERQRLAEILKPRLRRLLGPRAPELGVVEVRSEILLKATDDSGSVGSGMFRLCLDKLLEDGPALGGDYVEVCCRTDGTKFIEVVNGPLEGLILFLAPGQRPEVARAAVRDVLIRVDLMNMREEDGQCGCR